jgi:predicted TIM-barrel fold metal-dependent hydrolase
VIVDAHAHVWEAKGWRPDAVWQAFPRIWARTMGDAPPDPDRFEREVLPLLIDPGAGRLRAEMDAAGIDASIIVNIDLDVALGDAPISWQQSWARLAELANQYPGRLYLAPGLDPRRANAVELFKRSVVEWGARALKLWPPAGFYPTDAVCRPLYAAATALGVPVIFHAGFAPYPFQSMYAQPMYVDSVAVDYPELTIVLAHVGVGLGWYPDAVAIATTKPNVHLEFSMWQGIGDTAPPTFVEALTFMRDRVGSDRLLFGSDRTGTPLRTSQRDWVEMFRTLPQLAPQHGHTFSAADVELILGENARRIFHLPTPDASGIQHA